MRHVLALLIFAAPVAARADAITDLIQRQRAEAAAMPDTVKPSDREECRARAIAAGGTVQRQLEVQAACVNAARLRAAGR